MPACGSGSEVKPGVPSALFISSTYVKPLMPSALQWLWDYLPYVKPYDIPDTAAFCAADRPAILTTPASGDFLTFLLGGDVGVAATIAGFVESVARAVLWDSICQCVGGTTSPTPFTPPTAPTGLPAVNPPEYSGPGVVGDCLDVSGSVHTYEAAPNDGWATFIGKRATEQFIGDPFTGDPYPLPVGATTYTITWANPAVVPGFQRYELVVQFYDATPAALTPYVVYPIDKGQSGTHTDAIPAGAVSFCVFLGVAGWTYPPDWLPPLRMQVGCGASGGGFTQLPCCPPDEIASGYLRQILDMVTLIQRQNAPFSTVEGATHAGLTGQGFVDVQGLIGARIVVTTIPGRAGRLGSDPEFLYDLGSVSWGSDTGHSPRDMIHTSPQLSFPRNAGQYTRITYSLLPGVEASIVEIKREP